MAARAHAGGNVEADASTRPASQSARASTLPAAAGAAAVHVQSLDLPQDVANAALGAIRQHPHQTRWALAVDRRRVTVVCSPLPQGAMRDRATPATVNFVQAIATHELLKAESLLRAYADAARLTDLIALREAVERVSEKLLVSGTVKGVDRRATLQNDFAVAVAIADAEQLDAKLLEPANVEVVKDSYRDVLHAQARQLMARENFGDAVELWRHLHDRQLVSQALYLDAAQCFQHLGNASDCLAVLTEAVETFRDQAAWQFFEKAGDLALRLKTAEGDELAETCFKLASKKLIN